MLQGAKRLSFARDMLQRRLDDRIDRVSFLNIRLSGDKSEQMHMIPQSSNSSPNENSRGIRLYNTENIACNTIKSLAVIIDHRLTFRIHAAAEATKQRSRSVS